jgi:hypothetical protein
MLRPKLHVKVNAKVLDDDFDGSSNRIHFAYSIEYNVYGRLVIYKTKRKKFFMQLENISELGLIIFTMQIFQTQ